MSINKRHALITNDLDKRLSSHTHTHAHIKIERFDIYVYDTHHFFLFEIKSISAVITVINR